MMASQAENDFLVRIQAFAKTELTPAAAGWSMGQSPDAAMYSKSGGLGLTGIQVPRDLGGQDLGFAVKAQVCGILAYADFGFAMSLINSHNVAARLCRSAVPTLRDRYLPSLLSGQTSACTALTEPSTGSDFAAIRTKALSDGDNWVLSGEKRWIVNGRHAGLAIVFAKCGDVDDASGIAAFLVDLTAPGVRRYAIESGFSQTSIGTGGFVLDAVELPGANLLLPAGTAFKSILTEINGARTYVAAMCNGMLRAALDQATVYGTVRHSFGKPLNAHPGWQAALERAGEALTASEDCTAKAIQLIDSAQDAQLAAAQAKIKAVESCQHHLPELMHAMGAEGLLPNYPFTRHLAATQMAALADGATNILRERVARLTRTADEKTKD